MKTMLKIAVMLLIWTMILVACGKSEPEPQGAAGIANPASVNCEEKGGTVVMQTRGDGGEYGVCVFADNRQCDEWAMYRGDCPEGGIDTTPYGTPAALFCAISGAEYAITDKAGAEDEQGTCTFKSGKTCDVWEFYNGTCSASE